MDEEIVIKLKEIVEIFKKREELENQIDSLRNSFVKMFNIQFPLLFNEYGVLRHSIYWDDGVVDDELQILLRSAVKGSNILYINAYSPSDKISFIPRILSPKYGLKEPRLHRYHSLLRFIIQGSFGLIDEQNQFKVWRNANFKNDEIPDLIIDFGSLLSEKRIIQVKLLRFIELFKEAISLKLFYLDLRAQERFREMFELCDINEYSGFQMFEKLYENWDKFLNTYSDLSIKLEKFKKMETSLVEKLKEENRNFRIVQKIRNSD